MPSSKRLLLPLLLGLAAGAINYFVVAKDAPKLKYYVKAKEPIAAGQLLDAKKLDSVGYETAIPAAVPWDDAVALNGRRAPRAYQPGDLVLRQDMLYDQPLELSSGEVAVNISLDDVSYEPELLQVGAYVGFVVPGDAGTELSGGQGYSILGPYRLVAIGSMTAPRQNGPQRSTSTISVAVRLNDVDGTENLEESGARLMQSKVNREIVAIAYYPAEDAAPVVTASVP
jgi:hypothetical protein